MGYTEGFSEFLVSIQDVELDSNVIERTKIHILDTIGVAVGGSGTSHSRDTVSTIEALNTPGNCTVIGRAGRANVLEAAFLNAVMAHSIDFDDAHRFVHPGAAVIPAALAFAEHTEADGHSFLRSVITGYEASVRLSLAGGPVHRKRGYHPTGTCNVAGATASAAALLDLDASTLVSAIGIACSQAGGLTQYRIDGAATKHLHAGFAARAGGLSALLAKNGLRGPAQSIEGELGFLNVLADGGSPQALVERLGETFAIATTDIKPYPSCRQTHAPVDLALAISADHVSRIEDIESIELWTYEYCDKDWHTATTVPQNALEAMLNIPYCLAAALLRGRLTLQEFSEETLKNSDIRHLMAKTSIRIDNELTRAWPGERGARLIVRTATDEYIRSAKNPRGGTEDPLDFDAIARKFQGLCEPVFGDGTSRQIIDAVQEIERSSDVRMLTGLLSKPACFQQAISA